MPCLLTSLYLLSRVHFPLPGRRFGPEKELPTLNLLILTMVEPSNLVTMDDAIPVPVWGQCAGYLRRVIKVLDEPVNQVSEEIGLCIERKGSSIMVIQ